MKIAVIDNYDSFTYNLVHLLEDIESTEVSVYRNDQIQVEDLKGYDLLVLSPGPGIPDEAGDLKKIIDYYVGKKPIFGVCLGLQAIVEVLGGKILNLDKVFHGVATPMHTLVEDSILFDGLPQTFEAARYHSWVADKSVLPEELEITVEDESGQIMAIRHKEYPIHAVQFHPESILTPSGKNQLVNLVKYYEGSIK